MAPMQLVPMKNMKALPQDLATTCWYTCMVMMYDWAGWNADDIKPAIVGAGINWDDACKTGLKTKDYHVAAKAVKLHGWGCGTSWSAGDFKKWLTLGPVWVAGRWRSEGSHNVIVIGASDDTIRFIDPWWEGEKEANIADRSADWFIHGNKGNAPGTDYYAGWIGAIMNFATMRDV
jgi:hypothetical protein